MTKTHIQRRPSASRAWLLSGAAAAVLLAPGMASAQSTPAEPEQSAVIEDVIVTAQRRQETSQRAAIAIDVVSSEALVAAGVTKASDLTVLVPSLQVTNSGGSGTSFYLRGVGAFTNNSYADPAIAFNYDGVYVGRPAGTSGVFYDIERLEVLKGPQGTLYGRNATGGAINVLPVRPRIGDSSGYATASYGNYDAVNVQGAVNIPLSDVAAARVSAQVVNRDGYLSDGTNDDKGYALRGQLLFEITPDLNIRLATDYYKADGMGGGSNYIARTIYNPMTRTYTIQPSGLGANVGTTDPRSGVFLTRTFAGIAGRTTTALQRQAFTDNDTFGVNVELNWTTSLGTLTLVPAYRRFNQNGIQSSPGFLVATDETDEQTSLEARFASNGDGPFSWLVGGFYYQESIASDFAVQQQVLDSFQVYDQDTESLAAFGRVSYALTDTFRLVAGGRYTRDEKTFGGTADVLLDICTAPTRSCPAAPLLPFARNVADVIAQLGLIPVNPINTVYIRPGDPGAANTVFRRGITTINQSREDSKFTYRVGAEWDVAPASLLYASYETGFRSGGFAFSQFNPTFGPEEIQAYTVGSKNRFLDNSLQLNLELFYWKYTDQQISHQGQDPATGQAYFTENIGSSVNKGIEVEMQYRPFANTRLTADVQYLDANYESFVYNVPAVVAGAPSAFPLTGCVVTSPTAPLTATSTYSIDCSGREALRSPEWTLNFGAAQIFDVGGLELTVEGNTHYQSANNTGFEFLDIQRVGGYWTSGASATLTSADDAWSASVFVNNIENDRRGSFTFNNDSTATITQVTSAPRTYGIRLGAKF